jgi:ferritin
MPNLHVSSLRMLQWMEDEHKKESTTHQRLCRKLQEIATDKACFSSVVAAAFSSN